ncbi:hypothetical protein H6P81_007719 [Aristolochia fimbriata]|uniref:Cation/H+ exchanger domain-containing protein n=1 Tax=Aristolochia fimbriata TaxID=158543 RepID=A0AAV7F120_ARIFI|nr:hypothetical protein H6P81_007719 [Aristolochia fimbriata]
MLLHDPFDVFLIYPIYLQGSDNNNLKLRGISLGPSALGRGSRFTKAVFPHMSLPVLETLANLGLLFFLFLVGVELDPHSLRRTRRKALAIVAAGVDGPSFLVFMGVALSITAFPVLVRILAELKLLTTDVGCMALSATECNDVIAWVLLALAISLSASNNSTIITLWVLLSGMAFIFATMLLLHPLFSWMAQRSPTVEPVKEIYICSTLAIVFLAAFVTDTIGIHALFGAFVVDILIPKDGQYATALGAQSWGLLGLVTATSCLARRNSGIYQHRTILRKDKSSEVRLLACFNNTGNIPTITNLIEAFRVGRIPGGMGAAVLTEMWMECRGLGPIGNLSTSSSLSTTTSVLVVQQYTRQRKVKDLSNSHEGLGQTDDES